MCEGWTHRHSYELNQAVYNKPKTKNYILSGEDILSQYCLTYGVLQARSHCQWHERLLAALGVPAVYTLTTPTSSLATRNGNTLFNNALNTFHLQLYGVTIGNGLPTLSSYTVINDGIFVCLLSCCFAFGFLLFVYFLFIFLFLFCFLGEGRFVGKDGTSP